MSIFRKGRETPSAPQPSPVSPSPSPSPRPPVRRDPAPTPGSGSTHIARGTKVIGEITGDAQLVIDGVVEGEIRLDSLVVVGSEGTVRGTIHAVAVRVGGKVFGNIHGKERVEVLASGRLEGDIVAPSVPIAEGAFFQGKVDMSHPQATPQKSTPKNDGKISGKAKEPSGKPEPTAAAGSNKPTATQSNSTARSGSGGK